MKQSRAVKLAVVILTIVTLTSFGIVQAYNGPYSYSAGYPTDPYTNPPGGDYKCPNINVGSGITVDGTISDWDTDTPTPDLFAPMFRPNAVQGYTYQSDLFLRYDPGTNTLYVLVLVIPAFEGSRDAAEAWVKLDGENAAHSLTDFEWVEYSPAKANVRGFEASLILPEPTNTEDRSISVHINVYGSEAGTQTSRTFVIPFTWNVIAEGSVIALAVSMFVAFGTFVTYRRRKL